MHHYVIIGLPHLLVQRLPHEMFYTARQFVFRSLRVFGWLPRKVDELENVHIRTLIARRYFVNLLYDMTTRELVGCCVGRWRMIAQCAHISPTCEMVLSGNPSQQGQEAWRREQLRHSVMCSVWLEHPRCRSFVWCDHVRTLYVMYTLDDVLG